MKPRQQKNIPEELRALRQWVCSAEGGRPINPRTNGNASSKIHSTWGSFAEAVAGCAKYGHSHVALALTKDDPYCIVDLDNKEGKPASSEDLARFDEILAGLDSYTERSRSGRGWHVVVKAEIAKALHIGHFEIYDRGKFMTFTGDVDGKSKPVTERYKEIADLVASLNPERSAPKSTAVAVPLRIEARTDDHVIDAAGQAGISGARFLALHAGDWEGKYPSHSEADMAYMGMLWNASGDPEQIEKLFRSSALYRPDKEQRSKDYIAGMVAKVSQSPPTLFRDDNPASMFSDLANAKRIEHHMGSDLLFVPGIGWHVWDGSRWSCDPLEARRHVGKLGRIVQREAGDMYARAGRLSAQEEELAEKLLKFAGQSENVAKIDAAMTAAEPLLRCNADQLDADPLLLGCVNGVVDLRSGELLPPDSQRFITKSTGVAFDPAARAPAFLAFLHRIFQQHADLPAFVQRLAGFWLTGLTDPATLAVLHGVGANGKSTLVNALQGAMGDYAAAAPPGLLMAQYGQRHPAELAALQGRRFVVAAESGEGGRLDEEKVKSLTGSDEISARLMRENFFTFRPTHKVAMMTNHKPVVRGTDEGIWRRLLLVPFDEVIPEAERDSNLGQRLRDEAPGILAWAVQGALDFQQSGLRAPGVVTEATKSYRSENDVIGAFLEECTESGGTATAEASAIYARYKTWADDAGERAVTKKKLGMVLAERGHRSVPVGRNKLSTWQGIRLVDQTHGSKALAGGKR